MKNLDKASSKKAPGINKPMVIGLFAFCLVVFVWAVFQGLSPNQKKHKTGNIAASNGDIVSTGKSIEKLPETYSDSRFANFRQAPPPKMVQDNSQLDSLKNQLSSLEGNYQQLQNQLTRLQKKPQPEPIMIPKKNTELSESEKERAMQSPILIPISTGYQPYNKTTAQKDKKDASDQNDDTETATVKYPKSQNELMAGSSIPAVLQTQVVSDVPGTVIGIVRQNVYDSLHGKNILVPKGTRLIGSYTSNVSYGQESLQIAFTRLIRPDGSSIDLSKFPGTSPLGTSGMGEEVNNHWGAVFGSALLSSVFSIPSILASNSGNVYPPYPYPSPSGGYYPTPSAGTSAKSAALQSIGQTASEVGSRISSRALGLKPTVLINPGYTFSVLVTKDLALPPYTGS